MVTEVRLATCGRWQSYSNGCRCSDCKQAWADYIRERNHRLGLTQPRASLRFYEGPYGKRGLSTLAETVLDVTVARTGRHWRDVVDKLVREHGADVTFPEVSTTVN